MVVNHAEYRNVQDREETADLLFFGKSPDHITHTGMYVGRGEFIRDSTSGHPGIQINRLKDHPWALPWTLLMVAARRVE